MGATETLPKPRVSFLGSGLDGEEAPFSGDALERLEAALVEIEVGTDHEVLDRVRDENLARSGQGDHPGGDVDGQAPDVAGDEFALAGVEPGSDMDTDLAEFIADRTGTVDCPARTREGSEESVPGALDLLAGEAVELSPDQEVVTVEQLQPAAVAQFGSLPCGVDDVGKQHGGQNPIRLSRVADPSEELFDLFDDRVLITERVGVIDTRELYQLRSGNVLGHIASPFHPGDPVADPVHNESRDPNGGEDVATVNSTGRLPHRPGHGRTTPSAQKAPPALSSRVNAGVAGGKHVEHRALAPVPVDLLQPALQLRLRPTPRPVGSPTEARRRSV
jgi:hypothetical protein